MNVKPHIRVFDTTLRDGEQAPGCSMGVSDKVNLARQLERLGVDAIEAGFAASSAEDFEAVRAVADSIRGCEVFSLSRAVEADIRAAAEAVKTAAKPGVHVFIATSPIHMKYKLKMTPDEVLARISESVSLAKSLCPLVEFSAEDAMRSEPEFLASAVRRAVEAGADIINIPDTVGYITPHEIYERIQYLFANVPELENRIVSAHCHNDLGMAVANTIAAVEAGAGQVECTVNGIGERAGNAALEEVVMLLLTRNDRFGTTLSIDPSRIYRTCRSVSNILGRPIPPNKPIVGANAFAHEAGIHQHGVLEQRSTYEVISPQQVGIPQNALVLGKHSGRHGFEERLAQLGVYLQKEELDSAFEHFKKLADKKKDISDKDLETIIGAQMFRVEQRISLVRFIVSSGNTIPGTATVKLTVDGAEHEDTSTGDGPVDASFKAINRIVGGKYDLADFTINSVGEGEDAQGEVTVRITSDGELFIGRGLSTDIIEASLLAYINAINKVLVISGR